MSDDGPLLVLVTGAAGLLGAAVVHELLHGPTFAPGAVRVRTFDLVPASPPPPAGVEEVIGDVRDQGALSRAMEGVVGVVHTAALVDWGAHRAEDVWAVNLGGTRAILRCAAAAGARALVYTSSHDVVDDGRPISGGDESLPLARRPRLAYGASKAAAEAAVVAANAEEGTALATMALRATGIFGPRDRYHSAGVVRAAARAPLRRIGDGTARCNHVFSRNLAHAHCMALDHLVRGGRAAPAAGRALFVTDAPAANFFDTMGAVAQAAGLEVLGWDRAVPVWAALAAAAVAEALAWLLRPVWRSPELDDFTRYGVRFITTDRWFTGAALRELVGYEPLYTREEAVTETGRWWRGELERRGA